MDLEAFVKTVRIATRMSQLALWQANFIKSKLLALYPDLLIELLPLKTQGDQILDISLAKIGGKRLFVKELEQALLNGQADIAVHSVKDLPAQLLEGLTLAVYCAREEARDALISRKGENLMALCANPVIGTSSLRRQSQIKVLRSDCDCQILRGNVPTRLEKLFDAQYDAIILAAAGLARLNLNHHISQLFTIQEVLPAVGQGALGIECRSQDSDMLALLAPLNDMAVHVCVQAERAMNAQLGGSCQVPVAGYAVLQGDNLNEIKLIGRVLNTSGTVILEGSAIGDVSCPIAIGHNVADQLLQQGARQIIDELL